MWWLSTPRTASVKPTEIAASGTSNDVHVSVCPARTSSSAFSVKYSASAAAYAWKYVRARFRSIALLHLGIFHSKVTSGFSAVRGRLITTLFPVALT